MLGRSHPAAALLAALTLLVAPAAAEAAKWLDPAVLSAEGGSADAPAVAVNRPGEVLAVWQREGTVEAAWRPPGGGFSPPAALGTGAAPRVGLADDGSGVVAFTAGPQDPVQVVLRRNGAFEPARGLDDGAGGAVSAVRLAVAPTGEAVLAWLRRSGGVLRPFAAFRPAGGDFGAPQALTPDGACELAAAVASGGHAVVAWRQSCGVTGAGTVRAARRAAGAGGFGGPDAVSADGPGSSVAAAVDGDGGTVVAWLRGDDVRAARAAAGQGFSAQDVATGESAPTDLALVAAPSGQVHAAWLAGDPARPALAVAPKGGPFGAATRLTPDGRTASALRLAVSGDGTAHVLFSREGGLHAVHRRSDGTLSADSATPTAAGAGALAADGEGNAVTAYVAEGRARAQAYDGAPPTITEIAHPGVAEATVALALSARATDRWSPVGFEWVFGDGATGQGADVSHVYTVENVLLTYAAVATDAAGNAARAERQVYVHPAVDRTPPVITGLRLDRSRFRVSRKPTAIIAAVGRGTRLRYTLSEPARVGILLERQVPGRVQRGRCVAPTRRTRRAKRCRRYEPVTLLQRTHPVAGQVSVGLTGRIVGRSGGLLFSDFRLRPGRYRVTVVARDSRNASAPAVTAFTVVRERALGTSRQSRGRSGTSTRRTYSAPARTLSPRTGSHEKP